VPGNRWDDLSPVSGSGPEAVPSADGFARELVSVCEVSCGPLGFCTPIGASVRAGYFLCGPVFSGKATSRGFVRKHPSVRKLDSLSENPQWPIRLSMGFAHTFASPRSLVPHGNSTT
jgi:hypothetical protein